MTVHANGQGSFLDELDAATPNKPLIGLLSGTDTGDNSEDGFDQILEATRKKPITVGLLVTGVASNSIIAQVTRPITGAFKGELPAHKSKDTDWWQD